jgi:hypothetical protein
LSFHDHSCFVGGVADFARGTGEWRFRFTILTLRPAKTLSRKNHTGGVRQQLGERTRLACSQRRLVVDIVDIVFMFDARARRTAAGAAALPIALNKNVSSTNN